MPSTFTTISRRSWCLTCHWPQQRQVGMLVQLLLVYWPWRTAYRGDPHRERLEAHYHDLHALKTEMGLGVKGCGQERAEWCCKEATEAAAGAENSYFDPWRTVSGRSWGLRRHPQRPDRPARRHPTGLCVVAQGATPQSWRTDGEPVQMSGKIIVALRILAWVG